MIFMSFKKGTAEFIYSFKTSSSEPVIFQALRTQRWVRHSLCSAEVYRTLRETVRDERGQCRGMQCVSPNLPPRLGASLGKQGGASPARASCVEPWNSNCLWKATASPCRVSSSFGHSQVFGCGRGKGEGNIWARRDKALNEGREGVSGGGTGQHKETVMGLAADWGGKWRKGMASVRGTCPGKDGRVLARAGLRCDAGGSLTRGRRCSFSLKHCCCAERLIADLVFIESTWSSIVFSPILGASCCILLFKSRLSSAHYSGIVSESWTHFNRFGLVVKAWVP